MYAISNVLQHYNQATILEDDYVPQRAGHASLSGPTASLVTVFAAAGLGLRNSLPPHLRDADLPYSRYRRH